MMKYALTMLICCRVANPVLSQVPDNDRLLLKKLDSVQHSGSVARHFASIYFNTTEKAVSYFAGKDSLQRRLIGRFESRFAGYFLEAAQAFQKGDTVPVVWKQYFADTALSPLVYRFLGINAHINGDLWQGLVSAFSVEELKEVKKVYRGFQRPLVRQYNEFYREACNTSSRIRLFDFATLHLGKQYGRWMLLRWRKRQFRLAELYYTNPAKFQMRLKSVKKKKDNTDRLIKKNLPRGFAIFVPLKKQGVSA